MFRAAPVLCALALAALLAMPSRAAATSPFLDRPERLAVVTPTPQPQPKPPAPTPPRPSGAWALRG